MTVHSAHDSVVFPGFCGLIFIINDNEAFVDLGFAGELIVFVERQEVIIAQ